MHYKDGQEVKLGDRCKFPLWVHNTEGGNETIEAQGVVVTLHAKATKCNASVAYPYVSFAPSADQLGFVSLINYTVSTDECELVKRV